MDSPDAICITTSTSSLADATNLGRINYVQSARLARRVDTIRCAPQHTEACHTHTAPWIRTQLDASDWYLPSGRTVVGTAQTSHNKPVNGTAQLDLAASHLPASSLVHYLHQATVYAPVAHVLESSSFANGNARM